MTINVKELALAKDQLDKVISKLCRLADAAEELSKENCVTGDAEKLDVRDKAMLLAAELTAAKSHAMRARSIGGCLSPDVQTRGGGT